MTVRRSVHITRIRMAVCRELKGVAGVIHTIFTMQLVRSNRWFAERNNVNNAWNFNGNRGNLNTNNVTNTNTVQAFANPTSQYNMLAI